MNIEKIRVNNIPACLWGNKSSKVFIAVHGNMSNKEDEVIKIFANEITSKGYQVLSFDLPEHGERKEDKTCLCKVENCVSDLKDIVNYAKLNFDEINLWACSMGAYFSLLAYKDEAINQSIFLSPVVDMKIVIENMMQWANVTKEELEEKKEITTNFGVILYADYYKYVLDNPIHKWHSNTSILYGALDNMQDENTIRNFVDKFDCKLTILEGSEHYFHTPEQLDFYKKWLEKM